MICLKFKTLWHMVILAVTIEPIMKKIEVRFKFKERMKTISVIE
jgi:hypothetical protein